MAHRTIRGNASKGVPANWPSAYDEFPNTIVLDQFAVYYERIPNEAQKDHFDWGWRVTSLYGQDYRFTTSKGMLSQQLLVKNAQYGWDPVMFYLDFYFPHVAQRHECAGGTLYLAAGHRGPTRAE